MSRATMGCGKEACVMRHDPAGAAIIMLRSLKMPRMAQAHHLPYHREVAAAKREIGLCEREPGSVEQSHQAPLTVVIVVLDEFGRRDCDLAIRCLCLPPSLGCTSFRARAAAVSDPSWSVTRRDGPGPSRR